MPATEGARPTFARRLREAATERLSFKLAALFFACVLWLVVSAEEPTEQVVQIVVAPRLDSSLVLVGRRPVVRALVVGRARELLELAADPPVARPLVAQDARSLAHSGDSVEVAVLPSDVEVPTNVQVLVREVRPRSVTIQVARIARPVPPATAAESALAGLVTPRMRTDTGRAVLDTVDLDTLTLRDTLRDPLRDPISPTRRP
jgi:hypothetical protein